MYFSTDMYMTVNTKENSMSIDDFKVSTLSVSVVLVLELTVNNNGGNILITYCEGIKSQSENI